MSDHSSSPSRAASVADFTPPDAQTARPYRFTWDPSTRKPGPRSVSETTEGKGDYFPTHLHSGTLNSSLVNLAPGAFPAEWSSSKHGFHGMHTIFLRCQIPCSTGEAISTVLNNPRKS